MVLGIVVPRVDDFFQHCKRIKSQNILNLRAKLLNLPDICYFCRNYKNSLGLLIWRILDSQMTSGVTS
jgi:hypothetical protein